MWGSEVDFKVLGLYFRYGTYCKLLLCWIPVKSNIPLRQTGVTLSFDGTWILSWCINSCAQDAILHARYTWCMVLWDSLLCELNKKEDDRCGKQVGTTNCDFRCRRLPICCPEPVAALLKSLVPPLWGLLTHVKESCDASYNLPRLRKIEKPYMLAIIIPQFSESRRKMLLYGFTSQDLPHLVQQQVGQSCCQRNDQINLACLPLDLHFALLRYINLSVETHNDYIRGFITNCTSILVHGDTSI